jgi:hypothetical protein
MREDLSELEEYLQGALAARTVALHGRELHAVAEVVHSLTTQFQSTQAGMLVGGDMLRLGHGFGRRTQMAARKPPASRSLSVDLALRDALASVLDPLGPKCLDERVEAIHDALQKAGVFLGQDSVRQCALSTARFIEERYARAEPPNGAVHGNASFGLSLYGAVIGFHQGAVCFSSGELPPLHPALAMFVETLLAQRSAPAMLPAREIAHRALDATIETWGRITRGAALSTDRAVTPELAQLYHEIIEVESAPARRAATQREERKRQAARDLGEIAALHAICHARRVARELGADASDLGVDAIS